MVSGNLPPGLTSPKSTRAKAVPPSWPGYQARIAAYDQKGPGLNAITVLNPDALKQARQLDAERKKSLVGVLSQLSNISNSESPMQFLIITHDAEIFEDSTVERIYKFESSENGSKVIAL